MDCTGLLTYRAELYACFTHCADVLMNTTDALLTETTARSFPELSLSSAFARRWPSLYQGVEDGRLDRDALRRLFVASLPLDLPSETDETDETEDLLLGIDASSIYRPYAKTSADRTAQYVHNLSGHSRPVRAGWSFSTLVVLPPVPSSSTYVLDNTRIQSDQSAADVALDQLGAILPLLKARLAEGTRPRVVGDRYYPSAPFLRSLNALKVDGLFRIQGHRRLYRAAPPRDPSERRGPGRPRLDGASFQGKDPTTHPTPDASYSGIDEKGRPFEVKAWKEMHLRACREVSLWVYQVSRPQSAGTKRDPKTSWFVSLGRPLAPEAVPGTYARRFSQEHGYKFDKGSLLWDRPSLRTPLQFQLWTDLVAAAHNEIVLARPIVQERRLPWESPDREATLQQVRRGLAAVLPELGTPAQPCQPRGNAPGRPKGAVITLAPRFAWVRKSSQKGPSHASPRSKRPHKTTQPTTAPPQPTPDAPWIPPPWLLNRLQHATRFI